MHFTSAWAALLCTISHTLSAPTSGPVQYDEPQMCGYVLTERNSSAYAGLSAYSACTAIYYNQTIPGYQDAYAYSIFGGCRCTFYKDEDDCEDDADVPVYEGPIGKIGKEPQFDGLKPKWYNCDTMNL